MKKYRQRTLLILLVSVFLVFSPAFSHAATKAAVDENNQKLKVDKKAVAKPAVKSNTKPQPKAKPKPKPVQKKAPVKKQAIKPQPKAKPKPASQTPAHAKKFIITSPTPAKRPVVNRAPANVSKIPTASKGFSPRLVTKDPAIKKRTVQITRDQNFEKIMRKLGFNQKQIDELARRLARETGFIALNAGSGQRMILTEKIEDNKRKLLAIEIPLDNYTINISKTRVGRVQITKLANKKAVVTEKNRYFYKQGQITGTLNGLTSSMGIPQPVANWVNRIASSKINTAKIARGDRLELLYMYTYNGEGVRTGIKLLYVKLNSRAGNIEAYRFSSDKNDSPEFYDVNGNSYSKSMLSSPLRGKHKITSGYGYRSHPIFRRKMLHSGVDFGTRMGTPVYAAGDGTIDKIGRFGGYGNYIRIKHDGTWSTAYAHLNGFVRGMSRWKKVKKGTLIAYTGTSGRSTGPHLHFELHQNGKPTNPLKAKLPVGGRKLIGRDLYNFRQEMRKVGTVLAQQKSGK